MGLKANILLKRTVIISLICFSIFVLAGIALIFKSSVQRDSEHIRLVALSGKVENKILEARILIDEFIMHGDYVVLNEFDETLDSVRIGMEELHDLYTRESAKNRKLDISSFRDYYSTIVDNLIQLEEWLDRPAGIVRSDTAMFNAFDAFMKRSGNLHAFLPNYLFTDTVQYKREISAVVVIIFTIILLSGFVILKLINQLISVDRKQVIKTIEVENRERERIAADLHDGLGAMLSGLIIHIQVLKKENRDNPELAGKLNHLNDMSKHALKSIEEVINNLNPSALTRYGLIGSLERIAAKVNQLGKTQFSVTSENFTCQLSDSTELLLYRICSELINNALKHSSAQSAEFKFYDHKKMVFLDYTDDGIGFDRDPASFEADKSGLSNLVRRVESLEGNYHIHSEPGKGVHIRIMFKTDRS